MHTTCPRCQHENRKAARFCARCGLALQQGVDGSRKPGCIPHPQPLPPPSDFLLVAQAADLHYRLESAWGGKRVLDTENIGLLVFNAGYGLTDVVLSVSRHAANSHEAAETEYTIDELPRGQQTAIEIASWELADSITAIRVRLVSARFAAGEEAPGPKR